MFPVFPGFKNNENMNHIQKDSNRQKPPSIRRRESRVILASGEGGVECTTGEDITTTHSKIDTAQ